MRGGGGCGAAGGARAGPHIYITVGGAAAAAPARAREKVLSYVPAACVYPDADFYSTLALKAIVRSSQII